MMLTSTHGGAIVTGDNDRYLGVVDFGAVVDRMRDMQNEAQQRQETTATAESTPEDGHDPDAPMDDRESSDV